MNSPLFPHAAFASSQSNVTDTGYLRLPEVLKLIPVSKSTWWLGIKTGRFPKGINLGGRVTAWHVTDIRKCIDAFQQQARS